ncbi:hypothetical protein PENSPDRAFT_466760 [Peniophora sp. CONT]|nr:hypothetical protein PENSPDRAFT_466760 [Peniophora sp. CONT]
MSTSLELHNIIKLNITVDPDVGEMATSTWSKCFAHASRVTRLVVDSREVPTLSYALGHQNSSERKVSLCLFPRLAVLFLRGARERDIFFLNRALDRRGPFPTGSLGFFWIRPDVKTKRPGPRIVQVTPNGKHVNVRARFVYKHREYFPGRDWPGFEVRKAVKNMITKQRAKKLGKHPRLSAEEHDRVLDEMHQQLRTSPYASF